MRVHDRLTGPNQQPFTPLKQSRPLASHSARPAHHTCRAKRGAKCATEKNRGPGRITVSLSGHERALRARNFTLVRKRRRGFNACRRTSLRAPLKRQEEEDYDETFPNASNH
ncbi:hypothetical protein MRX96_017205 [Rhipicephalus microplus]